MIERVSGDHLNGAAAGAARRRTRMHVCAVPVWGPASERVFCGPINDDSDQIDYEMARRHLARRFQPLRIGLEIARLCGSAERLVRTIWARDRIEVIADALLKYGTLSGADIATLG